MSGVELIRPHWPAPDNVCAVASTRAGGVSEAPFDELNLGDHVGDQPRHVVINRDRLRLDAGLPSEPVWLTQVHGTTIADLDTGLPPGPADGAVTGTPGVVCAVMTADCLPVLFCNLSGTRVGAAHAGWRGLADGVLESAVAAMACPAADIVAWLGPAIGQDKFEVGNEVREAFRVRDANAVRAFRASGDRWVADLYLLARQRLHAAGVNNVHGGGLCTFTDAQQFFSYRRDRNTGRMATTVWLRSPSS